MLEWRGAIPSIQSVEKVQMRLISCKSLAEFRRPQTTEESARPTCVSVKPYGEFPLRCFFCVEWGVGRYRWSANYDTGQGHLDCGMCVIFAP